MEAASELKGNAEKARKDVFRFAQHVVRLAIGMVGWNVNMIRKKGVVAWAAETKRLAPIKAREAAVAAEKLVKDRCFQATAASSVGGAVALGTAGGVAGLATGATIGGACGLFAGAAAGGTTGAVGGGAVGYGMYQRRDQIAKAIRDGRQEIRKMSLQARQYARERVNAVRAAFAGGRK